MCMCACVCVCECVGGCGCVCVCVYVYVYVYAYVYVHVYGYAYVYVYAHGYGYGYVYVNCMYMCMCMCMRMCMCMCMCTCMCICMCMARDLLDTFCESRALDIRVANNILSVPGGPWTEAFCHTPCTWLPRGAQNLSQNPSVLDFSLMSSECQSLDWFAWAQAPGDHALIGSDVKWDHTIARNLSHIGTELMKMRHCAG